MTLTRKNRKPKRVFTKKEFASGDGFLVSVWGPIAWTFLHTLSFNYPINPTPEDKIHYRDFVLNLHSIFLHHLEAKFSLATTSAYSCLDVATKNHSHVLFSNIKNQIHISASNSF